MRHIMILSLIGMALAVGTVNAARERILFSNLVGKTEGNTNAGSGPLAKGWNGLCTWLKTRWRWFANLAPCIKSSPAKPKSDKPNLNEQTVAKIVAAPKTQPTVETSPMKLLVIYWSIGSASILVIAGCTVYYFYARS
uniref:RxLR effector protein n=1 Tax=Spongospora subterranea TaxID=70186 RepID=A0A0H5R2V3_9EUKA|eukprot:CRZ08495.1 hypothetical protein [Spongospora subterranea]